MTQSLRRNGAVLLDWEHEMKRKECLVRSSVIDQLGTSCFGWKDIETSLVFTRKVRVSYADARGTVRGVLPPRLGAFLSGLKVNQQECSEVSRCRMRSRWAHTFCCRRMSLWNCLACCNETHPCLLPYNTIIPTILCCQRKVWSIRSD